MPVRYSESEERKPRSCDDSKTRGMLTVYTGASYLDVKASSAPEQSTLSGADCEAFSLRTPVLARHESFPGDSSPSTHRTRHTKVGVPSGGPDSPASRQAFSSLTTPITNGDTMKKLFSPLPAARSPSTSVVNNMSLRIETVDERSSSEHHQQHSRTPPAADYSNREGPVTPIARDRLLNHRRTQSDIKPERVSCLRAFRGWAS